MARRAAHAREAMSEDAAAQVLGKLALDVARQAPAVGIA
jgi:ribosomal protein L13